MDEFRPIIEAVIGWAVSRDSVDGLAFDVGDIDGDRYLHLAMRAHGERWIKIFTGDVEALVHAELFEHRLHAELTDALAAMEG